MQEQNNYFVTSLNPQSPSGKIYQQTNSYFKKLNKSQQYKNNNLMIVAERNKQRIKEQINKERRQDQIYKNLIAKDQMQRSRYSNHLSERLRHAEQKLKEKYNKHFKKYQKMQNDHKNRINKHLEEQFRTNKLYQQQSSTLKDKQIQFYKFSLARKKQQQLKQVSCKPIYQKAIQKLQVIAKKNQQYAQISSIEIQENLKKNDHKKEIIRKKSSQLFNRNEQKKLTHSKMIQIFKNKELKHIGKSIQHSSASQKALKHKEKQYNNKSLSLSKYLQERKNRFNQSRSNLNQERISPKCEKILNKSLNLSASSFRSEKEQQMTRMWQQRQERLQNSRIFRNRQLSAKRSHNQQVMRKSFEQRISNAINQDISINMSSKLHRTSNVIRLQF